MAGARVPVENTEMVTSIDENPNDVQSSPADSGGEGRIVSQTSDTLGAARQSEIIKPTDKSAGMVFTPNPLLNNGDARQHSKTSPDSCLRSTNGKDENIENSAHKERSISSMIGEQLVDARPNPKCEEKSNIICEDKLKKEPSKICEAKLEKGPKLNGTGEAFGHLTEPMETMRKSEPTPKVVQENSSYSSRMSELCSLDAVTKTAETARLRRIHDPEGVKPGIGGAVGANGFMRSKSHPSA